MRQIIQSVATKALQKLGYVTIESEQLQIVMSLVRGHDVLGVLLTALGKTVFFLTV